MITVCWSAKGGSGTTVVATSIAIVDPGPTLLVDLAGDVPTILGLADSDAPGVYDWLRSSAPPDRLGRLEIAAGDAIAVLPRGVVGDATPDRWMHLVGRLRTDPRHVVIDAGSVGPPPHYLLEPSARSVLVTRSCYLALRAAVRCATRPTEVVLVKEPGRSLHARDVEACLGCAITATVPIDPAIARAVDAGLLASRLPASISKALREAA